MHRFNARIAIPAVLALALAPAVAKAAASTAQMVSDAMHTVAVFKKNDPTIETFFARSAGYAVFPGIAKGAVGIGGAHGDGVVFEAGRPVGKVSVSQVSVGAQLGGQEYSEIIFFETPQALAEFMKGESSFSGQVSAVALKSGAAAGTHFKNGVAVFTATKAGLMAEASVGGQKFKFEPFTK